MGNNPPAPGSPPRGALEPVKRLRKIWRRSGRERGPRVWEEAAPQTGACAPRPVPCQALHERPARLGGSSSHSCGPASFPRPAVGVSVLALHNPWKRKSRWASGAPAFSPPWAPCHLGRQPVFQAEKVAQRHTWFPRGAQLLPPYVHLTGGHLKQRRGARGEATEVHHPRPSWTGGTCFC